MTVTSLVELAELPPEDVDRFFAGCDAEVVVGLVDAASDRELARLAEVDHVRAAAVRHVLARLPEFAVPARLAEVEGVVEFAVTVPGRDPEVHGLLFDARTVTVLPPGARPADVVIRTGAVDFLRLVSGGRNAALLLLAGHLSVEGDEMLALAVGGVFQVPGRPGVAVDPAEVDPVAVARVLGHTEDAHLRAVMAGGFRPVVLEQVFTRFPEFLDTAKAGDARLTIGFKVTGGADGEADRYVVHVADGRCRVTQHPSRGEDGDRRDATLTLSGADLLRLVTGHLNPVTGVVRGSLKVRGDVKAALRLHRIMRIPQA
ncbi:MAG: SCP2 sterol-binding domain-containing protein [Nocardioidaceae bacterium]